MIITVVLDIPVARQIIVFLCISFVPGILLLRILRLNLKDTVSTILFSVGLSVASLIFLGLLMNELCPLIGVSQPLSTIPLLVSTITILLSMALISHRKNDLAHVFSLPSPRQIFRASLLAGIPLLAILGALLTNSLVLLLMAALISLLILLTVFSKRFIPIQLHSFVLLVIAISLLFHTALISRYLSGWDVFTEFYVFRLANSNSSWNATIVSPDVRVLNYNGMLSVTILPTIYSSLLNLQGEWIFQVIYLLLFSLVPIILYQAYEQGFGKLTAFLSAFYFVLFPRFYIEERRTMIAELFLALLIFLMLNRNMNPRKKQILLIIFGASLIVSHYSLAYIYMFGIAFVLLFTSLIERYRPEWHSDGKKIISASLVLLFFVMTFSWYAYVSISVSTTSRDLVTKIARSLYSDFFSLEARGELISESISPDFTSLSFVQKTDFVVNKIPYFFILIGIIDLLRNNKKKEIAWEYVLLAAANAFILFIVLVLPHLAPAFLPERFYHTTLLFLAPVCVLGGKVFLKWIPKPFKKMTAHAHRINLRLVCIFFVFVFLLKVGFVSEVASDVPKSVSISFTRMKTSDDNLTRVRFYESYVPEQDIFSAIWLSEMTEKNSKIYADAISSLKVLRGYGMTIQKWKYVLSNDTRIEDDAYVYLRHFNVKEELLEWKTAEEQMEFSKANFSHLLKNNNKVYSNGYSEIYRTIDANSNPQ